MNKSRPIHPDFLYLLEFKEQQVIELFSDLREYILDICPDSNELVYHTHALTSVFSVSEKLADAFCIIPIYTNHMNLGFNRGTLLDDPYTLLTGTGKLMRHIPINDPNDYRNDKVKELVKSALELAIEDLEAPIISVGKTISKINLSK